MRIRKGIRWTQQAMDILRDTYPDGGTNVFVAACEAAGVEVLHDRACIQAKAHSMGLTKKLNAYPTVRAPRSRPSPVSPPPMMRAFETVDISKVPSASMGRVVHGLDVAIDMTIEDLGRHLSTLTANAQQVQIAIGELRKFAERRRAVVAECRNRNGQQ